MSDMHIKYLELPAKDLIAQRDFYARVLELPVRFSAEKLEVRAERLRFVPGEGNPDPRPYAGCANLAAEALIICCIAARLHGDSTHVIYIAKKAFIAIWSFLPEVYSTWRTANGFLAPDSEEKFAAHPLTRDEHLRQERDLNDVKRMVRERCSIIDIVESLEKRSKAVALFPIGSGTMP